MILAKNLSRETSPEAVVGVIFGRFSNVDSCRLEVDSDVISSMVVDPTGVTVRVKYGDTRPNRSPYIRLPHLVTNDNDNGAGRRTLWQYGKTPCVGAFWQKKSQRNVYFTNRPDEARSDANVKLPVRQTPNRIIF